MDPTPEIAKSRKAFRRTAAIQTASTPGLRVYARRVHALDFRSFVAQAGDVAARNRLLTLVDLGTGLVVAERHGVGAGDAALARAMLDDVPAGSLLLLDERRCDVDFLFGLRDRASDFLVRAGAGVTVSTLRNLGEGDDLVVIAPARAGDEPAAATDDAPWTWVLRQITYRPEGAEADVRILASITDPSISRCEWIALDGLRATDAHAARDERPLAGLDQGLHDALLAHNAARAAKGLISLAA